MATNEAKINIVPRGCSACGRPRRECENNIWCHPCKKSLERFQAGLKQNGLRFDAYQGMDWALARFKLHNHTKPKRAA